MRLMSSYHLVFQFRPFDYLAVTSRRIHYIGRVLLVCSVEYSRLVARPALCSRDKSVDT